MTSTDRWAWSLLALVAVAAGAIAADSGSFESAADSTADLPTRDDGAIQRQCVLLRNGNVLFGQVHQVDGNFVITRPDATIHLAGHQVAAVCEDLVGAYLFQRRQLPSNQGVPHLKLAEWCLQHGLLDEAARDVEEAARLEPNHPRLAVVQRRLALARERPQISAVAAALHSSEGLTAGSGAATWLQPENLLRRGALRQAQLPDDAMEQFRRKIQPLLLNSCTAGGCHRGEPGESFALDRRALWRDAPHTLSGQNLHTALGLVDFSAPLQSRLLQAARTPHAKSLATAPIPVPSASYDLLQDWVLHLSGGQLPAEIPGSITPGRTRPASGAVVADEITDEELDALVSEDEPDEEFPPVAERTIQRGLQPIKTRGSDPFDPAEFNRRFSPR